MYNYPCSANFSLGDHTLSVPMELFSTNRARLCERLRRSEGGAVVVLQGGESKTRYCSDTEEIFRQVQPECTECVCVHCIINYWLSYSWTVDSKAEGLALHLGGDVVQTAFN